MSNYVRRLVSGNKARFKDKELGLELDLVYLTDRVIIMGFPASGMEGFYRNPREEAKRFLDNRHGENYRVYNFCPIKENSYPASTFGGRVSRYPFPDHHAPPLGLLALATKDMVAWLKRDADNVIVLHCKAGKGRSGTLACSLLLIMDEAIEPPKLQRNYNASEWADFRADEIMQEIGSETDTPVAQTIGDESDIPPSEASHETVMKGERATLAPKGVTKDQKVQAQDESSHPAHLEVPHPAKLTAKSTVERVLKLHTSRRMKRKSTSQGVSIPSQRRWLRYWSEVLHGVAPAQLQLAPGSDGSPPKARLYGITIKMRESGGGATVAVVRVANMLLEQATSRGNSSDDDRGAGRVWVSLARYDDEMVEEVERRIQANDSIEYESDGYTLKNSMFATTKWDDKKMINSFARLGVAQGDGPRIDTQPDGTFSTYNLVPLLASDWVYVGEEDDSQVNTIDLNEGIVLDSSREVRIKLYVGQVFMGWIWFIPCFHLPQPASKKAPRVAMKLARSDIDFPLGFGVLLEEVELSIGWDLDTTQEEAPLKPEKTQAGYEKEPNATGVLAAVVGNVEALQAAQD